MSSSLNSNTILPRLQHKYINICVVCIAFYRIKYAINIIYNLLSKQKPENSYEVRMNLPSH